MSYKPSEQDVAAGQAAPGEGASHIEPDDVGVGLLTMLGALSAVVVLLTVVLLQVWFYDWKVGLSARRAGPLDPDQSPVAIKEKQLQRIESYGWADPKTKHVRTVPIDRAMELVAEELAAGTVYSGSATAPRGKEGGGK